VIFDPGLTRTAADVEERPEALTKKQWGGFRYPLACLAFLCGRSRSKFCSRTNDGDRFQHSDPACGSLLMRRYQSKWTLLGN